MHALDPGLLAGQDKRLPRMAAEILTAAVTIVAYTGARLLFTLLNPDVVTFPLVFPAVAAAAIIGGWRSGLMAIAGCQIFGWLLPLPKSTSLTTSGDAASFVVATAAQLLMLWVVARYGNTAPQSAALSRAQSHEFQQTGLPLRQLADRDARLMDQEAELRATRKNLEAIYEASGDGLALCEAFRDENGHVVEYQVLEVNRAHAELTSATREQMLTQKVSTIYPPIDPRWFETAEKVLATGVMHDFDIRSRANGRWLNIRVSRVSDTLFQQTFVDVSDRHRLEEQRRALLKEMSHRVMNNFQMVAGFLHMEANFADEAAKAKLQIAERRIHVLARLHTLLAYTESENEIDAGAYIRELCAHLESTFERAEALTLSCVTAELTLPTDKVVPLGFIVSELVTNSAKYAYPPPATGNIYVSLLQENEGWTLTVRDKGRGIVEDGPKKTGGLGTALVRRFVQQLDAELVTTSGDGLCHRITFKP